VYIYEKGYPHVSDSATARRGAPPAALRTNREAVVRRAASIISAEGLGAFTLRRLADDLGVTPNALYNHVADRDDLLDAVVDLYVSELVLPVRDGEWPGWVRSVAVSFREQLLRNPGRTELFLARAGTTAAGPATIDAFVGELASLGVDRATGHLAWHAVLTTVVGSTWQDRSRRIPRDDTFLAVLDVVESGIVAAAAVPTPRSVRLLADHGRGAQQAGDQSRS
jgi:TetR/AcrR family transcriptional regulator, tetracycline repressor protein